MPLFSVISPDIFFTLKKQIKKVSMFELCENWIFVKFILKEKQN